MLCFLKMDIKVNTIKDITNWIKETYNDKYLSFSKEEQYLGKLASLRIIEGAKI